MEPVVIYKDDRKINDLKKKLEDVLPAMNRVVIAFNKFDLGGITPSEMATIVNVRDNSFIKKRVAGMLPATPLIGGMKLKKEAFEDMVELPKDMDDFCQAVEEVQQHYLRQRQVHGEHVIHTYDFFEFKADEAVVNEDAFAKYVDKKPFTFYATTENQLRYFNSLKKICDAVNESLPLLKNNAQVSVYFLYYLGILNRNGVYRPHEHYICSRP